MPPIKVSRLPRPSPPPASAPTARPSFAFLSSTRRDVARFLQSVFDLTHHAAREVGRDKAAAVLLAEFDTWAAEWRPARRRAVRELLHEAIADSIAQGATRFLDDSWHTKLDADGVPITPARASEAAA
jgi:hypothetical protein